MLPSVGNVVSIQIAISCRRPVIIRMPTLTITIPAPTLSIAPARRMRFKAMAALPKHSAPIAHQRGQAQKSRHGETEHDNQRATDQVRFKLVTLQKSAERHRTEPQQNKDGSEAEHEEER